MGFVLYRNNKRDMYGVYVFYDAGEGDERREKRSEHVWVYVFYGGKERAAREERQTERKERRYMGLLIF